MLSASDLKLDNNTPEFVQNIIACVNLNGHRRWFVTDATSWHLNAPAVHIDLPSDWRAGFLSIDEQNLESYLATLTEYETTSRALHAYFVDIAQLFDVYPEEAEDHIWDIYPTLLVDADRRVLCVFFDEYIFSQQFCDAAPVGWHSLVHSRLDLIPDDDRYWIVDREDMIAKHLFDWTEASCLWDSQNPPHQKDASPTNFAEQYKSRLRPWWKFW